MTYHFNVTGPERKKLAKFIGELIGQGPEYQYMPTCAYQIGPYTLSKDGALSWNDLDDADPEQLAINNNLIQSLEAAGYHSDEADFFEEQQNVIEESAEEDTQLSVSMPREKFTDAAIKNLEALIASKGELMKRAFQVDELPLQITDEQISFPWFKHGTPEETAAYIAFIQAISEMAINQKRISSKAKEIVNEKYEFRCLLLRLGMIGEDTKRTRKILMRNLSGCASFMNGLPESKEK